MYQYIQLFIDDAVGITITQCVLLRLDNNIASEEVLESVEKYLQTYPFSYQGARIITGQEEGAFGWVTVNYLSDNLRKVEQIFQCSRIFIT